MENLYYINKITVEIKTSTEEEAHKINTDITPYLENYIIPEIEKQLDLLSFDKKDSQSLIIDRLSLKLNTTENPLNDDTLSLRIGNQLEKEINNELSNAKAAVELNSMLVDKSNSTIFKEELHYKNTSSGSKKVIPYFSNEISKKTTALFVFLETGKQVWWANSQIMDAIFDVDFITKLNTNLAVKNKIKTILSQPQSLERLILQFNNHYKKIVYNFICTTSNPITSSLFLKINLLPQKDNSIFWSVLFNSIYNPTFSKIIANNPEQFVNLVYTQINDNILKSNTSLTKNKITNLIGVRKNKELNINYTKNSITVPKPLNTKEENNTSSLSQSKLKTVDNLNKDIDSLISNTSTNLDKKRQEYLEQDLNTEDIVLNHVGLLLLHPFFKYFFKKLNLLSSEGNLTDPETAVHLLHYIVTGNEKSPEHEMSFEKYICNIPIATPIKRNIEISKKQKEEVKLLLKALKKNWKTISKFSVSMIQNEFLKRPGKIIHMEEGTKIIVERRGLDILMNKMDWGIGLIKLPWKNHFIYVNW